MEGYVSVVPRLLPSEYSLKKLPMNDQGYQYVDNRPAPSYTSSQINRQGLNPRAQQNAANVSEEQEYSPHPHEHLSRNSSENSFKGQTNKTRFHHEALKDNSDDQYGRNVYPQYPHGNSPDYKLFNNSRENSSSTPWNGSTKILILIFGIVIALFSLTALAISIYLLVKMSNTSSSG